MDRIDCNVLPSKLQPMKHFKAEKFFFHKSSNSTTNGWSYMYEKHSPLTTSVW